MALKRYRTAKPIAFVEHKRMEKPVPVFGTMWFQAPARPKARNPVEEAAEAKRKRRQLRNKLNHRIYDVKLVEIAA